MTPAPTSAGKLVLLVGTVKGVFIYQTDLRRESWQLTGPHLGAWKIFSLCGDRRNRRIPNACGSAFRSPGVFRTNVGGETWQLCNEGLHNVAPAFITDTDMGRCVHKMVHDPVRSGVLFTQYHGGVFKSEDGADTWTRISNGLPHDFGFPMAVTQRGDLLVVPLLSDENRVVPGGALKVWRSRDEGRTWRAFTFGLPQQEHYVGVLRDAMTADALFPAGVYLGATAGELFASKDDGENWERRPGQLPRITCLRIWAL